MAKREEAGLQLVALLTSLQEAELQLADPLPHDVDIQSSKKSHDKLQVFLTKITVRDQLCADQLCAKDQLCASRFGIFDDSLSE